MAMPTLRVTPNPGSRVAVGDTVLAGAKATDIKPVKERFHQFQRVHKEYLAAEAKVEKAEAARRKAISIVAERDVEQDHAVMELAGALAGDGLPRLNPFKALGFEAPSSITSLEYEREARVVTSLARAVQQRKGLSKASVQAAEKAAKAAEAVVKAVEAVRPLERARREAIAERDRMEQPWETALAGLKAGARAAKFDGAGDLYSVLFEVKVVKGKKKR
jgi:hypothetical protein